MVEMYEYQQWQALARLLDQLKTETTDHVIIQDREEWGDLRLTVYGKNGETQRVAIDRQGLIVFTGTGLWGIVHSDAPLETT